MPLTCMKFILASSAHPPASHPQFGGVFTYSCRAHSVEFSALPAIEGVWSPPVEMTALVGSWSCALENRVPHPPLV